MSHCIEEGNGKDRVIFATKEDLSTPSKAVIIGENEQDDESKGATLPNGDINWKCPCFERELVGPCSSQYRESFTCFHFSKAEPKGADCAETMLEYSKCVHEHSYYYSDRINVVEEQELDASENKS